MDLPEDDRALRAAALAGVAQCLIESQEILDGYDLHAEAAHVDAALNGLKRHVPVPEIPFEALMVKLRLVKPD